MSNAKTNTATATEPMEVSEYALKTNFEGTAAQLVAAGVLPQDFKFPKRTKGVEFIAENGFEYSVDELWEPRGRYEVTVSSPHRAAADAKAEKMTQDLLKLCSELALPERMGAVVTGVLCVTQTVPGSAIHLVQVSGDCHNIENLRFRLGGPAMTRGDDFCTLENVIRVCVVAAGVATGEFKRPPTHQPKPAAEKTAPAPVPVKRRPVARLLQTA